MAGFAYEEILGDLNKRHHKTHTLGKLWRVSSNSPRIVGAMIAAGVTGAAEGMADLLLFKLMGLDELGDYAQALADFGSDVTAAMKVVSDAIEQGFGGTILYNAILLGVKFNPRHAILAHGALKPVFAAIFAKIGPMYRAPGGLESLINVHVKEVQINEVAFQKFAKFAAGFKLGYGHFVDMTDETTVAKSLRELLLIQFLGFLQTNKMIRYNVRVDGNMDPNEIDPKLLDELFA